MKPKKIKTPKFDVYLLEYERGWGSKIDEVRQFDSKKEADEFIEEFNSRNKSKEVPDWYMIAERGNYE